MNTRDFLQGVLPLNGRFVAASMDSEGRTRHHFCATVDDLAAKCLALDAAGRNTYFAVASFGNDDNRKHENVHALRSLILDIDCGENKPYPSWEEGIRALQKFIVSLKLPRPMVVFSGRGLHVYWPLEVDCGRDEWRALANALKQATIDYELHVDRGLTANPSVVLRPVGTHNPKNGNEVRILLGEPDVVSYDQMRAHLAPFYNPATSAPKGQSVSGGMLGGFSHKASGLMVATKCNQIKWAVDNPDKVTEPFWYRMLGVASACHGSEAVAIEWSKGHPEFNEHKVRAKLAQWVKHATGPALCSSFAEERPSGCKQCPYRGEITTPAMIGAQYEEAAPQGGITNDMGRRVPLPSPYKRVRQENGRLGIVQKIDGTEILICDFDIYVIDIGYDDNLGYEVVRLEHETKLNGWQIFSLRQAHLNEGDREFGTKIFDKGMVLDSAKQIGAFQTMLRRYRAELAKIKAVTRLATSMGWRDEGGFVIGDVAIVKDEAGEVSEVPAALASAVEPHIERYAVAGDKEAWLGMTELLDKGGLDAHKFAIGMALSAPLYKFEGLKGIVVSLYGDTGSGKTLAQYMAQSVYGNPDLLHYTAKFTQNALFARIGMYANLPMTIDETTMMPDKDAGDFCYWVSQGEDKSRLNRLSEEREVRRWATPVIVSTNRSMQSKLTASGHESDAQMARLLELSVKPAKVLLDGSDIGRSLFRLCHSNYGHAGREFLARLVALGEKGIKEKIDGVRSTLSKRHNIKFTGRERYWEQAVVLVDTALTLAHEWGIVRFAPESVTEWITQQINPARKALVDTQADEFDFILRFMADYADATLVVLHTRGQEPMPDMHRMPRNGVRIRIDVHRENPGGPFTLGTMAFDRTFFRNWLATNGGDYNAVRKTLQKDQIDVTPTSGKVTLGKHSAIRTGQTYVVQVDLRHARLKHIITNADPSSEENMPGKLDAVDSSSAGV